MPPVTGRRSTPISRAWRTALSLGTLAVVLSGCASAAGTATPDPGPASPKPTAVAKETVGKAISGHGPTPDFPKGASFPLPDGARSVVVDFECAGGGTFTVELGDSMMLGQAPLSGTCDGTQQLTWPVSERTDPTLHVMIDDDVDWRATPRFSTEQFASDPAITSDCEAFSEIHSALMNADVGYTQYDAVDEADWRTRVAAASTELKALAEASETALAAEFAELHATVSGADRSVGAVLEGTEDAIGRVQRVCDTNQTPLVIMAEFGG